MRAAIEAPPEPLKTAVLLLRIPGPLHAEAAAIADYTPKAVETRLYRARTQLRKALAKFF